MRYKLGFMVLSLFVLPIPAIAQQSMPAEEKLEKLRLELINVQSKEASLRTRAQQLEEDMKPENIARSLAGFGSTKPEELREFRRRQLELEKKSVLHQLETASAKRLQLEAEIALAETQAYHESAQLRSSSVLQMFVARTSNTSRPLLIGLAGGVFAVMGVASSLLDVSVAVTKPKVSSSIPPPAANPSTLSQWRHWYFNIVCLRANSDATFRGIGRCCANPSCWDTGQPFWSYRKR